MTKEQFIDKWIDNYLDKHPDEKISDFKALEEQADCAWYDEQVDHDEKTEYDLTPEQEKVSQEARKGMARAVNAYGKQVKRERKPNEAKREIVQAIAEAMANLGEGVTVSNIERQVDFTLGGVSYSVTLTAHRPPKTK